MEKALSNTVSPINDVNTACGHFNQTLLHTMDKHAPIRTRLVTLRPYAPWFDDSLRSLKRKKRQLECRYRSTGLEVHRQVFSEHCTLYYDAINNIRRKWRLGAHRQLYTWRATEPLQDGTTPRGQQYPQPSHEPPPQCREKTKQNKTTLTWAPVTLKEIQWKPIK